MTVLAVVLGAGAHPAIAGPVRAARGLPDQLRFRAADLLFDLLSLDLMFLALRGPRPYSATGSCTTGFHCFPVPWPPSGSGSGYGQPRPAHESPDAAGRVTRSPRLYVH